MTERLTEEWHDDMEQFDRYAPKSPNIEINCGGDDFQRIIDKLAEYEIADKRGRLVVLPCKVGDVLYKPTRNFVSEYKVRFIEVSSCNCLFLHTSVVKGINDSGETFKEDDIGKTVFHTREEAEKALEEMKNALEKHITARIKSEEMVD